MVPIEIEQDIMALELMIRNENNYVSALTSREDNLILERYCTGVDGEMEVLIPGEIESLSFSVPRGYMFDI